MEAELNGIEAVERVEINGDRKHLHVDVYTQYTDNLPELVTEIDRILSAQVKQEYTFDLHDHRNEKIEAFFREVEPAVYEGARVGNYRSIQETVANIASEHSIDEYYFSVDHQYVYLQVKDGDNYLFVVIPHFRSIEEDKLS
ncbi:MAG: hypothetical protein WAO23_08335 [Dethiobacteria bacterium]